MKRIGLILSLLICAHAASAAEAPFAPLPNVPDYVAVFAVKPISGPPRTVVDTVMHHGAWTRIDSVVDGREDTVNYFGPGPISIDIRRDTTGAYSSLQILRGIRQHSSSGWERDSSKTDDQDEVVGEHCDVWKVGHLFMSGRGNTKIELKSLSCVTSDGIQLWKKFVGYSGVSSSANATSIERKPVSPNEVYPPADLLDLAAWLPKDSAGHEPSSQSPGDVTVVMERDRMLDNIRRTLRRIVRRHHPWLYTEDIDYSGSRTIRITNDTAGRTIIFESDAAGEPTRLTIMIRPPSPPEVRLNGPKLLDKREVVLGELCEWFDMWPGTQDAGLHQCRTRDGVVLKEQRFSWGSGEGLVAAQIKRTPVSPAKVLPLRDILSRSAWGIPD